LASRGGAMLAFVAALAGLVVGGGLTAVWLRMASASRVRVAETTRKQILSDVEREVETRRREAEVEVREEAVRLRAEIEREVQDRRVEIAKVEERVVRIEADVEAKLVELQRREQGAADRETHLKQLQDDLKATKHRALEELQRISGLTLSEARQQLLERSEDLVRHELARGVRQMEEEARTDA